MKKIEEFENAVISIFNLDGWKLKHVGGFSHYDAIGKTPKGVDCVLEIKHRSTYYETKMLEKYKYDKLIEENKVALYFVNDPKGNYLFWLNNLEMPDPVDMYCPDTTLWTKKKLLKPCYLLTESMATIVNQNEKLKKGVYDDYFAKQKNKKK